MSKNKPYVLMCYHSAESGGVEKHILDIIGGLSKDFNIIVVVPNGSMVNKYLSAGAIKHVDLYPRFEADFGYVFKIYKLAKKYDVDIIHSHELKTGSLATFAGWLAGVSKRIYHVHTPFSQWRYGSIKKYPALVINTIVNAIVGNVFATDVIALTNTIKDVRVKKEFIRSSKIRVIPNGVDMKEFKVSVNKRELFRTRIGVTEDTFLIGNISRFTKEKGHEYFIKAFSKLVKDQSINNLNIKLLLAGGGILLDDMKKLAKSLGLGDRIIFTGRFEDKDKVAILNAMDLFVFPTYAEGFGIVLIEAMACGLPIISSDLPVLKDVGGDVIKNFKTGDVDDLYIVLRSLILDKKALQGMKKKSLKRASLYSMDKFRGYYRALYNGL